MFPYIRYSTKLHLNAQVSREDLPFHRFFNRMKLNTYLTMVLGLSLTQALSVLLILCQVPFLPLQSQSSRHKFLTILFILLFSFSGAILDILYLFISSHYLRLNLPQPARIMNSHQSYLFLLSFLTLMSTALSFLITSYSIAIICAVLIILRFVLPQLFAIRDIR